MKSLYKIILSEWSYWLTTMMVERWKEYSLSDGYWSESKVDVTNDGVQCFEYI